MCPRCKSQACSEHGLQGNTPWCAVCEKERIDDIELAVAEAKLASPTMVEGTTWREDNAAGAFNIVSVLGHIVTGPIRVMRARRAARRAFPHKSLDEIALWRASNFRAET
jgi:hypothetical protein